MVRSNSGCIAVGNPLIDAVEGGQELPTFLVNVIGIPPRSGEPQLRGVAMLQAMAPIFRVVVLTDRPLFTAVRGFGWPVEHIPPPEHGERVLGVAGYRAYVGRRIALASSHFKNVTVVGCLPTQSLAERVAAAVGLRELGSTAQQLLECDAGPAATTMWKPALDDLNRDGAATFAGTEGEVALTARTTLGTCLLVLAQGHGDAAADLQTPPWVCQVEARFAAESSLAFESFVYSVLAREVGQDLSVVVPWRTGALQNQDALHWVDLGVRTEGHTARVRPEYVGQYRVLAGSDELKWAEARQFAMVRRVVTAFS